MIPSLLEKAMGQRELTRNELGRRNPRFPFQGDRSKMMSKKSFKRLNLLQSQTRKEEVVWDRLKTTFQLLPIPLLRPPLLLNCCPRQSNLTHRRSRKEAKQMEPT